MTYDHWENPLVLALQAARRERSDAACRRPPRDSDKRQQIRSLRRAVADLRADVAGLRGSTPKSSTHAPSTPAPSATLPNDVRLLAHEVEVDGIVFAGPEDKNRCFICLRSSRFRKMTTWLSPGAPDSAKKPVCDVKGACSTPLTPRHLA